MSVESFARGWRVRPERDMDDGEPEARQAGLDSLEVAPEDHETVRAAFFDGWDACAYWQSFRESA